MIFHTLLFLKGDLKIIQNPNKFLLSNFREWISQEAWILGELFSKVLWLNKWNWRWLVDSKDIHFGLTVHWKVRLKLYFNKPLKLWGETIHKWFWSFTKDDWIWIIFIRNKKINKNPWKCNFLLYEEEDCWRIWFTPQISYNGFGSKKTYSIEEYWGIIRDFYNRYSMLYKYWFS